MNNNALTNTDIIDTKPRAFELYQNYPNPFNPETSIKYQIPVSSYVELKVFDMIGREIVTLVDEEQNAGNYEIKFSAKNLETGIYLYRIKANNLVCIKKMILLK